MRIFLIRHGESLGNVDETVYAKLQDHNVPLTQWGYEQAIDAGKFMNEYYDSRPELADKKIRFWHSPHLRTVQTKDGLLQGLGNARVESVREDYALREQDFGLFSDIPDEKTQREKFPEEFAKYTRCRELNGKFFARPPMGESRADVALRARVFGETFMRDVHHGQEDIAMSTHGVTKRAIIMNFLHKGVQWFEDEPNPGNCDITLIEGDREKGYTATCVYKGKSRPPSLPKDYKATAYEQGRSMA